MTLKFHGTDENSKYFSKIIRNSKKGKKIGIDNILQLLGLWHIYLVYKMISQLSSNPIQPDFTYFWKVK